MSPSPSVLHYLVALPLFHPGEETLRWEQAVGLGTISLTVVSYCLLRPGLGEGDGDPGLGTLVEAPGWVAVLLLVSGTEPLP